MNPWAILGLGAAWAVTLGVAGAWQNHAGHVAERVDWQRRDNAELRTANVRIQELEGQRRAEEERHALELDSIAMKHEKEISDAATQKTSDVAAARAGALSLRIPTTCESPARDAGGEAAAGAGVGDGGATAELPREITADLYALADDADAIVLQLNACQAVVRSDRGR
jgi:hypothetical protein